MFSKKSAGRSGFPSPDPDRMPMATRGNSAGSATFSVLGSDLTITGDIAATADLHIDGTVTGDIACAALVQGESSRIEGGVTAESARLAGHVTGSITARELVILKSARIEGDVHYDALTIEQGAQVEGRFARREDKPARASTPPELAVAN